MRISLLPAFVALALGALVGCAVAPDISGMPAMQKPKSLAVQRADQKLVVKVDPATGMPLSPERANILRAVAALGHPEGAQVTIAGPQPRAQLKRVADAVAAAGIDPTRIELLGAKPSPASKDTVEIVFQQYALVVPNCPDWSEPDALGNQNVVMSNLGCANAVNLGAMVANPKDLVEGRSAAATDGAAAASAVTAQKAYKPKPLASTTSTQGGSSSGGDSK